MQRERKPNFMTPNFLYSCREFTLNMQRNGSRYDKNRASRVARHAPLQQIMCLKLYLLLLSTHCSPPQRPKFCKHHDSSHSCQHVRTNCNKKLRLFRHLLIEWQAVDLDYDSAIEIVSPSRPHQGQGSHKKSHSMTR